MAGESPNKPLTHAEAAAIRQALLAGTLYQRLGVRPDASRDDISQAYLRKVREHHPDRHFHRREPGVAAELEQILVLLNEAREVLTDPLKRREYDARLKTGQARSEAALDERERVRQTADVRFEEGIVALKAKRFPEAVLAFRAAAGLVPSEARFHRHLAEALLASPETLHEARNEAMTAVRLAPQDPQVCLLLGRVYESAGLKQNAVREYRKALELAPGLAEARRRLEALAPEPAPPAKRGGLFERLRGRG